MRPTWQAYLGNANPHGVLASPLYGEMAGLPPTRIHVGDDEVLLDDSRRYVDRAISAEDHLPQIIERHRTGAKLKVTIYDRSGSKKRGDGVLDGVDNQVDTSTGAVKLRALFQSVDGSLFPNEFVNVALLLDTLQDVVTVPAAAVQFGTTGIFVYRVNADNKTVSVRRIQTGPAADGRVAVLSGLAAGDVVVINGADHLSDAPGSPLRARKHQSHDGIGSHESVASIFMALSRRAANRMS
jgi:multidrug efflux pump subunit AcrA (membrane-fusion protein)